MYTHRFVRAATWMVVAILATPLLAQDPPAGHRPPPNRLRPKPRRPPTPPSRTRPQARCSRSPSMERRRRPRSRASRRPTRARSTKPSRTSRRTWSTSTANCSCSRKSCCSRPTRRWRYSSRWTSANSSRSIRSRSRSTTRKWPTTCTRRARPRRCSRAACTACTSATSRSANTSWWRSSTARARMERDYKRGANLKFEKGVGAKYLELKITDRQRTRSARVRDQGLGISSGAGA